MQGSCQLLPKIEKTVEVEVPECGQYPPVNRRRDISREDLERGQLAKAVGKLEYLGLGQVLGCKQFTQHGEQVLGFLGRVELRSSVQVVG